MFVYLDDIPHQNTEGWALAMVDVLQYIDRAVEDAELERGLKWLLIKTQNDPDPETENKYPFGGDPILEIARPVSANKPHREETLMNSASSTIVIYI